MRRLWKYIIIDIVFAVLIVFVGILGVSCASVNYYNECYYTVSDYKFHNLTPAQSSNPTIMLLSYTGRNTKLSLPKQSKKYSIESGFSKNSPYSDSVTSVSIPSCVTEIGISAFECMESLTSVDIANGLISIDNSAFYDCTALTSINIPSSVNEIGYGAFENCYSLTTLTFSSTTKWHVEKGSTVIDIESSVLGDPSKAAAVLTSDYVEYRLYRS